MKQQQFLKYIIGESKATLLEMVPAKKLTLKESLDIYQQGYLARLTEMLGEHYQACWQVLGDEHFLKACQEFISQNPSQEWNLNRYGKDFAKFLAQQSYNKDYPFLSELAQLEWHKQVLFHQADQVGLTSTEIEAQEFTENSRLELVSSVILGQSNFAIMQIYTAALNGDTEIPEEFAVASGWALYKHEQQVYGKSFNPDILQLLQTLNSQKSISEAVALINAMTDVATNENTAVLKPEDVQNLFQWLAENRLIAKITT